MKAPPVIIEKSVVADNIILVKATETKQVHIYQLDEGGSFDVAAKCLKNRDIVEQMRTQVIILLKGFLEAKDYL